MRKLAKESFALEYILNMRKKDPGIGGLKLWYMYRRAFPKCDCIGRDWFVDIIHRHGLKVRSKMRKPRTTDSTHGLPTYPNLAYDLIVTGTNQLWVSDITYINLWHDSLTYSFCYLTLITDVYSHEIIGWHLGRSLETKHTEKALEMALNRLKGLSAEDVSRLIHHSDRGTQYVSQSYIKKLNQRHIRISMTQSGDPKENAIAERINSIIKNELLKGVRFSTMEEAEQRLKAAIDFYNHCRPHMSVNMMTPSEAALCQGEIPKRWYSYRDEAIKKKAASCDHIEIV